MLGVHRCAFACVTLKAVVSDRGGFMAQFEQPKYESTVLITAVCARALLEKGANVHHALTAERRFQLPDVRLPERS